MKSLAGVTVIPCNALTVIDRAVLDEPTRPAWFVSLHAKLSVVLDVGAVKVMMLEAPTSEESGPLVIADSAAELLSLQLIDAPWFVELVLRVT